MKSPQEINRFPVEYMEKFLFHNIMFNSDEGFQAGSNSITNHNHSFWCQRVMNSREELNKQTMVMSYLGSLGNHKDVE